MLYIQHSLLVAAATHKNEYCFDLHTKSSDNPKTQGPSSNIQNSFRKIGVILPAELPSKSAHELDGPAHFHVISRDIDAPLPQRCNLTTSIIQAPLPAKHIIFTVTQLRVKAFRRKFSFQTKPNRMSARVSSAHITNLAIVSSLFFMMIQSACGVYVFARYQPAQVIERLLENAGIPTSDRSVVKRPVKRNAASVRPLPPSIPVCETKILENHQPKLGIDQNGSYVEIEQSETREFRSTFVECADILRGACFGIDTAFFTSECATLFGLQPASIRPDGSDGAFKDGLIKVPIACECRLRKKLFLKP
ncbi:unnamed protein product [Bursaphelenchus xylophilus]|uniref:(pine wood nematode) hypothetical protein n=1 Tax=Bursaphelenchus xylophilus TaxID=6326 RepID=A0A1I7SAS5_BURXY|nr:unnamed protein product [Bursaphelenchus xylophilus]CAG9126828.1 unnamed protein product [Bursaphelenchus xylophilus]